ncbi:MAG TPA: GH25 family lysozyme, partial [Acidimicrobiales bacterium]|nr:GH25 family lysozyme [Acidimicrobiales bacterium]
MHGTGGERLGSRRARVMQAATVGLAGAVTLAVTMHPAAGTVRTHTIPAPPGARTGTVTAAPTLDVLAAVGPAGPVAAAAAAPAPAAPAPVRAPAVVAGPAPVPAQHPAVPTHPHGDFLGATFAAHTNAFAGPGVATRFVTGTPGIDVSNWQGQIDWGAVAAQGVRFAYIKATEATTYTDPRYGANSSGASAAGLLHGAYHFAVPNASSGTAQADFFVDHGGTWAADGRTLPPALDIEYDPYGSDPCYGLSPQQMTAWVGDFTTRVYDRTGRWPLIYTTTNWWSTCTAGSTSAGAHSPLWLASWGPAG